MQNKNLAVIGIIFILVIAVQGYFIYDLKKGFKEMWRVLDDYGILLIKWNDYEISFKTLKELFPANPLFANIKNGAGGSKTKWFCFMKIPIAETETQGGSK